MGAAFTTTMDLLLHSLPWAKRTGTLVRSYLLSWLSTLTIFINYSFNWPTTL